MLDRAQFASPCPSKFARKVLGHSADPGEVDFRPSSTTTPTRQGVYSMTAVLFALGLAGLSGGDGQSARPSDESLRNTVRLEYPKALKALEAFYTNAAGEVLATQKRPGSKTSPLTPMIYRFASAAPGLARVTVQRVAEASDHEKMPAAVYCRNKGYSFILERGRGRAEFAIKSLAKDEKDKREIAVLLQNHLEIYLNAPFSFASHAIGWITERPKFSIRSVAETVRGGKRALSIHFDCPIDDAPRTGGYEGKLVVLPDEKWVVVQFEYWYKKGGNLHTGEVEYEGTSEGFPVPKRFTHSYLKPDDRTPILVSTYEFKNMRFGPQPEKEFTLSAFGLPEVDAVNPRRTGAVEHWLIGAGLVALSITVMLWTASARVGRRGSA